MMEISYPDAVAGVELALASMRQVSVGPEAVLRHLLIRSGLLRMPAPDSVDFLHRTFQDYLGAQAAVESRDFPLLAAHAHQDQWEDVVRLAVGHARPDERSELLGRILARADAEPEYRHRLRLLATACLDLLPGSAGLDSETALAVTVTAVTIGSDRAIPLLVAYAAHPDLRVRQQLAWAWQRFEVAGYGNEVIARPRRDDALTIPVSSPDQLQIAARLTGSLRLALSTPLDGSALDQLPLDNLVGLRLHDLRGPLDLTPLDRARKLRNLHLSRPALELDPEQLAGLGPVRLSLTHWARLSGWYALEELESVRELVIGAPDPALATASRPRTLAPPHYLSHLRISTAFLALAGLPQLDHLSGLTGLEIDSGTDGAAGFPPVALWESLRSLTAITELTPRDFPAEVVADLPTTPTLRRLEVRCTRGTLELACVSRKFPLLRELVVEYPDSTHPLDLRGLDRLRRCRVIVRTPSPRSNVGALQQLGPSEWLYTVP